jgi:ribosome-associated protein
VTDPIADPAPTPKRPRAKAAAAAPVAAPAKPKRTRAKAAATAEPAATAAGVEAEAAPTPDGLPRGRTAAARSKAKDRPSIELARRIVELAEDKKAAAIVLLDLTPLTTMADYFIVCSGGSERQIGAIADGIVSGMRDEGVRPFGREGTPASHWVLVDFGSVIVHVFTPPERDYYDLERHWAEAKTILRVE